MNKDKVRGYRNMLGLTQAQLGDRLGMTKQTYHNKEVGKNAFTDEEKRNFKELLLPQFPDITIDDIFF
ncbi:MULTISPECIES: helix-turn-helix transcriptional regulator [Streptococcus]|jgi:putative transcriptional regulator|uniref:helix-turn-helix transcriptional regulator n=1 Tax=Streptococcus TaxID=1301 RepID=UPI0008A914E1|nr:MULTISPECIES: helix-turn-helix domain-containing protein [Streptococcus]MEB3643231.1 helix-turn-helix domain-containing protein [Streptococcus salivarius]OHQ10853.1 transcriptional regulator [Streptococcus sp. HMSC064D12]